MTSRLERLLIALVFALLAAGVTLIMGSAQSDVPPTQQTSSDCAACHTDSQMIWENGAHGKAGSNPIFLDEWNGQGKPTACLTCHTTGYDPVTATYKADGVTCESCHSPLTPDHPKNPMPVEPSSELCGRCHSSAGLGLSTTLKNTHYEKGLDCASCHDPHSASLKTVAGPRDIEKTDNVSQLCVTCHTESNMDFSLTAHAQRNVSCADCHVEEIEAGERLPHTVPDHSFNASLASCNTCHVQQMHSPAEATNTKESEIAAVGTEPTPDVELASVTPEPSAVSPLGFSAMAALFGLAGGTVLAPWLERWYRRAVKQNREDDHDQAKH
jgi:predicted CXXCH cytochrome family protein